MKIAMILPHFYPYVGGGEKMFYDLAKGMAEAGHEVHVVTRNVGEDYLGDRIVDGIHIKYCPWKEMFGHPFPKRNDIEKEIRWCDVVHTSIFTTAPVVSILAKKYRKPSLLTVYEVRGPKWFWSDVWYKAVIYWCVEQFACRQRFDCYHAISDATKKDYLHYIDYIGKKRDVRRVYIANEMGRASEQGPEENAKKTDFSLKEYFKTGNKKVFLYYGRPGRTKGTYVYLDAIRRLRDEGADLTDTAFCFILGKEPIGPRREMKAFVKKEGLQSLVRIRPSVSREELEEAIRQADVVVVPSLTEGFGFSALEACQMGKPLIYSDGGSLPEVAFGQCSSFKNRDSADLAEKIRSVIEEKEDAFMQVPEKVFTYENMFEGITKIYREIIKKKDRERK